VPAIALINSKIGDLRVSASYSTNHHKSAVQYSSTYSVLYRLVGRWRFKSKGLLLLDRRSCCINFSFVSARSPILR